MNEIQVHPGTALTLPPGLVAHAPLPAEHLSFRLGDEEYGIDILKVQEIRGYEPPTRLAGSPAFIKGVVNLRGVIVPIIDLRLKFNLAHAAYNDFTVVIILNVADRVLGIVVDGVSDVIEIDPVQVRATPAFNGAVDVSHVQGLGAIPGTAGERLLILLDIERLMRSADMGLIALTH